MNKTLLIIAAFVIVAVGGFLVWQNRGEGPVQTPTQEEKYQSTQNAVSFEYPSSYDLTERTDSFEGNTISVITLIPAGVQIPDMSEGPAGMSLIVIPAGTTSLESFVRTKSIANFNLSPDETLAPTTIGGEQAFSYRYSGLYENDAVAVMHNGRIYLFSGAWIAADDQIREDFSSLLDSVTFLAQ